MRHVSTLIIGALLCSGAAWCDDRYLLIGGGPIPKDYHVSMERNAIWIQGLFKGWDFSAGETWYGLGPHSGPDVLYHAADAPSVSQWEPLARVFGENTNNKLRLRENRVASNLGPYSEDNLSAALSREIGLLGQGDSLLFVFSGHGYRGKNEAYENNALRLLHDKKYTAKSLAEAIEGKAEGSRFRFVLPQCFSGGFVRSVFRTPARPQLASLIPSACGFASVSETHIAEGCTAGVNASGYRDYSTYFFAALAGRSRTGETLPVDPDMDRDGRVSLLEAHYFALSEAQSTDVPRATSEFLLEQSQPWYARWLPRVRQSPDNPYARLGERLAARIGVDYRNTWTLLSRGMQLDRESKALEADLAGSEKQEEQLRGAIRSRLKAVSPVVYQPLSKSVTLAPSAEAQKAIDWIREQTDYPQLVELQERIDSLTLKLLDTNRALVQFEKIYRAKTLAILLDRVQELGTDEQVKSIDALRDCESWSPGKQPG